MKGEEGTTENQQSLADMVSFCSMSDLRDVQTVTLCLMCSLPFLCIFYAQLAGFCCSDVLISGEHEAYDQKSNHAWINTDKERRY